MTILHGVTGDTMPGDVEPRRVALRATADGKLLVDGAGGGGGASAEDIGEAVDNALRASALPVSGTVAVSNPPADPPSASAIGNDLRGGGALPISNADLAAIRAAAESNDPVPVGILLGLGTARRVTAGSTSASESLTASGIVGVSITAVGAAIRYNINAAATATSHYLPEGQSRDFKVAPSTVIHAIRADSTDGVLEITELLA